MKRRTFLKTASAISLLGLAGSASADEPRASGAVAKLTKRLNPKIQRARETALGILKPTIGT